MKEPLFIVIDLFCGAGGTTTGFVQAQQEGNNLAEVIACVNHDPIAIKSHWANHPEVKHFEEDIRTLDLTELIQLVQYYRKKYHDAYLILWASLECTNFSNAKGGKPRDADSRTLADHLPRYVNALQPDYVMIENVVEFKSWGPLDERGRPVSRKNGRDWLRWRTQMRGEMYKDDWTELNSANFGAHTSRNRLFGCFARPWLPIIFPTPTHAKNPTRQSMYGDLKKWRPVKECLDFTDEGQSIFNRKKELVDKSLQRIYAGLVKFVANGDTAFLSKYFSGKQKWQSVDEPAGVITTIDHHAKVQAVPFIVQRNTGDAESKLVDIDGPARTITQTGGNQDLVQAKFLSHYYSSGGQHSSIESPSPALPTKDRLSLIQAQFLSSQNQSIDQPAGSLLTNDKHRLVTAQFLMPTNFDNKPKSLEEPSPTITANRKHHYLVNPQWGGYPQSVENPCPVIIARQDKAPLYLIELECGAAKIPVYDTDTVTMKAIKEFMAAYNIADIKMRMLRLLELLKIQGFPHDYKLEGSQADQKKFIGNSVVPIVVKVWIEELAIRLIEQKKNSKCA